MEEWVITAIIIINHHKYRLNIVTDSVDYNARYAFASTKESAKIINCRIFLLLINHFRIPHGLATNRIIPPSMF